MSGPVSSPVNRRRSRWLLYGATGFTGQRIATQAVARGLQPVLAGRDQARVSALAKSLNLESRVVALDDTEALYKLVAEFSTVLHAAGPFVDTYEPMLKACLQAGTHYLDLSGEIAAYEAIAKNDAAARAAGIMLLAGAGFDMVPGDCPGPAPETPHA